MSASCVSRRSAILGLALAAPALTALAPAPLSADDAALVDRARAYLRSLSSAKGRFIQTDARGARSAGTFYLQRPGRARFEYDPPSPLVIAANGYRVAVANRRLKTLQAYPLGLTPLGLLLSREIRIDKGVAVDRVTRGTDGFSILVSDRTGKAQGRIALDFTDSPLTLAGWTITEAQGAVTQVRLSQFAAAAHFPASLFELGEPTDTPERP